MGLVDHLERRDTDRTARTMHQLDRLRQEVVDSVLHDGVGLPAADLHDRPGARESAGDLVDHPPGQCLIPVLVEVLHPASGSTPSNWARTSPISSRSAYVRRASSSST